MSLLRASLIHALRGFLRTPGFTALVLLTLALGIGANTAMFSLTHGLMLRPLPYPHAERLVALRDVWPTDASYRSQDGTCSLSASNFFDWREEARAFEGMAIYTSRPMDLAGPDGAENLRGLLVSAGFFEVLGAHPLLGRSFVPGDEVPEEAGVALLSHGLWMRRFGGDPGLVGRTVLLGGRPRTVVGVLPPAFRPPTADGQEAFFLPVHRDPAGLNRMAHQFSAIARLRPGVGIAQARSEMQALMEATIRRHPEVDRGWSATAIDLHRFLVGDSARPLLLLQGAVFLLLVIACVNVANMLLVRGTARLRESSLRSALGAGPLQLLAPHLAEGLLLGFGGGLLGLFLARAALRLVPTLLADSSLANPLHAPMIGPGVLAFAFTLCLATSLLFALVPALQGGRDLPLAVRRGDAGAPSHARLRGLLVLGQVALATVLLLGAGLLMRSFVKLLRTPAGFDPRQVIAFQVLLPDGRYGTHLQQRAFGEELVSRLASLPGVEAAATAWYPPLTGESVVSCHIGPTDLPPQRWSEVVPFAVAGPGYLETLRVPLLAGQDFARTGQKPEVIVNESFARRYFPGRNPLGQSLLVGLGYPMAPIGTPFEVVGVMADQRIQGLDRAPEPQVLLPSRLLPDAGSWYFLRSRQDLGAMAGALRSQVAALDGQVAVRELTRLEAIVARSLGDRRQPMLVLGGFALLALLLSGLGIYGVVAFSVATRTREIGVRMALGAEVAGILRMVFVQGLKPVALGAFLGLAAFAGLSRFLASQLYGVQASDPVTVVLTLALLSQAALLACLLPALRAARVAPAEALRSE